MSADAIERAARAHREAQPLTEADLNRMKRTPRVKITRRALELTQEEFALLEPDQPTRAYLTLIARDPEHVHRSLNLRRP